MILENRSPYRVAITGIGLITGLGATREDTWSAMLAGACGIRPVTAFDATGAASIAGVPAGSYLLVLKDGGGVSHVVETTSNAVDLGYDVLGRPDAVPATLLTH